MPKFTTSFNIPNNGHVDLDFVDIIPETDIRLFIDPTLIEKSNDEKSLIASNIIDDFTSELFDAFKHDDINRQRNLLSHAHEKNETHMGYCKLLMKGKGKTPEGLIDSLKSLKKLFANGVTLQKASELPIFTKAFAEDCMSDLLTNLLSKELYLFTMEIAKRYSLPVSTEKYTYYFWNPLIHNWDSFEGVQLINPFDENPIFLVPKSWVRNCYFVNVDEYIRNAILANMQEDDATVSADGKIIKRPKKEYRQQVRCQHKNNFNVCHYMTIKNPELLERHRDFLRRKSDGLFMTDEQLDELVNRTLTEKIFKVV